MKTSKIIFISLLGTIALIILATTINIRINGNKGEEFPIDGNLNAIKKPISPFNVPIDVNITAIRKPILSFKVLFLNDCKGVSSISVTQGDSSYIAIDYKKDIPAPEVKYTIKQDTLFVKDLKLSGITICATSSLNRINMNNSYVSLRGFTSDNSSGKLTLVVDQSTVMLYQKRSQNKPSIAVLNIDARNHSSINADNFSVDSLEITLRNSFSTIYAKKVSGSLSESSRITIKQPFEIALKRDADSKITVY